MKCQLYSQEDSHSHGECEQSELDNTYEQLVALMVDPMLAISHHHVNTKHIHSIERIGYALYIWLENGKSMSYSNDKEIETILNWAKGEIANVEPNV